MNPENHDLEMESNEHVHESSTILSHDGIGPVPVLNLVHSTSAIESNSFAVTESQHESIRVPVIASTIQRANESAIKPSNESAIQSIIQSTIQSTNQIQIYRVFLLCIVCTSRYYLIDKNKQ